MNAVPKSRAILAILLSAALVTAASPLRVDADEAVEPTVGEAATIEEALPGEGDLGSGPEAPLPEDELAQDPEQAEPAPEEVGQDPEEQAAPEGQAATDESLASQDQAPESESAPESDSTSDPASELLTSTGNPDDYLTATGDIPGWGRAGESFTVGDITYKFIGSFNDAMEPVSRLYACKYTGSASSITIPDVANGYQVYGISSDRYNSWQVESITVSKGIKEIGPGAFERCTALKTITFAPGSELTLIGERAFRGCTSMTSFTMPPKLEHIDTSVFDGLGAFDGCSNLTDIYFNDIIRPFQASSLLEDGTIEYEGYYNPCPRSRYVTYHVPATSQNFKVVDGALFSKDGSVLFSRPIELPGSTYTVPSGVREIASYAFFGTELLSEVNFPNTLERIGIAAFSNSSLTSVTIPDSVTFLGTWAFQYSTKLESVHIGSGLKDLSAEDAREQFMSCSSLRDITLSEGLEVISDACFAEAGITSLHIPSTVKRINYGGVGDCSKLAKVTGGQGLERINKYAFRNSDLSSFPFGDNLVFVSGTAFRDCKNFNGRYPSYLANDDDYDEDGINDYAVADAVYDDVLYLSGTFEYDMANEVLALVNQERAGQGLSALTIDSTLTEAAMQRAAECAVYFDHIRPTGRAFSTVTPAARAENIAAGNSTAASVMNSWMNSSGHRANILAERSKSIGIGCYRIGGNYYWVQLFGAATGDRSSRSGSVAVTPRVDISYGTHDLTGSGFNLDTRQEDPEPLEYGNTYQLKGGVPNIGLSGRYAPVDAQSFTWKSSDSAVASVSQDGLVTAGAKAGTATITATTRGGYTLTKTFQVKLSISQASVGAIADQTYTGLAFLPEPTVTMGSVTLSKGTDYTLSYANNVNAGTATVTVAGKGNYAGTAGATFTIKPASVSTATVTVADQVYTGSAIKPKPTVKKGSVTLVEGTDYTLSYKGNVNAGTATVTVAGRGNYAGSKDVSFKISRASISQASVSAIADRTHTGAAIKPKPTVKMGSATLREGVDYTLSYANNVDVGTATVTVTGTGGYAGSASRTFRVVAARVPMHRLYNPNTGEHFYTSDAAERDNLVRVGWSYEGVGWTAPSQSGTPVYRLYNSVVRGGDHHYTMDRAEYEHLGTVGWTQEGVGWYSDDARGVRIYREYNPNAMTGTHNYTASLEEHRHLVSLGWRDEGIGWYGLK